MDKIEKSFEYYDSGQLRRESYSKNNQYHQDEDIPAIVWYYLSKKVSCHEYYKRGLSHREGDKPAEILYYESGEVEQEIYYKNGQKHRDGDKDAHIWYSIDGGVNESRYYKYGLEVAKEFCQQDFSKYPVKSILKETNIQRKMMLIQLVGMERVLKESKGECISKSEDGQYELLVFKNVFSVPMKILKMRDPSIGVYYYCNSKPEAKTWEEALNYYYGGRELEFAREV